MIFYKNISRRAQAPGASIQSGGNFNSNIGAFQEIFNIVIFNSAYWRVQAPSCLIYNQMEASDADGQFQLVQTNWNLPASTVKDLTDYRFDMKRLEHLSPTSYNLDFLSALKQNISKKVKDVND